MGGPEVKSKNLILFCITSYVGRFQKTWWPAPVYGILSEPSEGDAKMAPERSSKQQQKTWLRWRPGLCLLGPQASWGPVLRSQHAVHIGPPQEIGQSTSQKTCHSSPYWHNCRYTPHLFSSINRKWIPSVSEDARSHVNANITMLDDMAGICHCQCHSSYTL